MINLKRYRAEIVSGENSIFVEMYADENGLWCDALTALAAIKKLQAEVERLLAANIDLRMDLSQAADMYQDLREDLARAVAMYKEARAEVRDLVEDW